MTVIDRDERQTMGTDLAYLIDAKENLNTRFPPPTFEWALRKRQYKDVKQAFVGRQSNIGSFCF